jgi:hypothetical protein
VKSYLVCIDETPIYSSNTLSEAAKFYDELPDEVEIEIGNKKVTVKKADIWIKQPQ